MATGFAAIQRNTITSKSGYKTLFEKITEKTKGEKKTFSWYRSAVKSEASSYNKNFKKYILNEKNDRVGDVADQDANGQTQNQWIIYYKSLMVIQNMKRDIGQMKLMKFLKVMSIK